MAIDAIAPVTAAALVSAGLLSVVIFPPIALARLRHLEKTPPGSEGGPAHVGSAGRAT